jgi:hypothetical protein
VQGAGKVMVLCGIWGNKIVGPVFFDTNLNVGMYLNMPQDTIMPSLLNEDGEFPSYFQQDEFTPHYRICTRRRLDQQFPRSWIGCCGTVEWPPRTPRSQSTRFLPLGALEGHGVPGKIRSMNHLNECIRNAITPISPDVLTQVYHERDKRIYVVFKEMATMYGMFCE